MRLIYTGDMAKRIIPFSWTPSSWALRGKTRELAEADYNHHDDPYELERAKAEIELEGDELKVALLEIDFNYGVTNEYDYLAARLEIEVTKPIDLQIEKIKLDMEFAKLERHDGEKQIANLLKEPWVAVINDSLDLTDGPDGLYFEFDWNEYWIIMLRQNGYEGASDEEIMERWFNDVCRAQIIDSVPQPINSGIVYD